MGRSSYPYDTDITATPAKGRTEADAIAEVATKAAHVEATSIDRGGLFHLEGDQILDLERYADRPRARRGDVTLQTADSFVDYVNKHKANPLTEVFGAWSTGRIVSVFNSHGTDDDQAGWGDHRATLALVTTPEWRRWTGKSGEWFGQEAFAEFIEESFPEIVDPPAAVMLELSQSIQATMGAVFKSRKRLTNGETQFQYEETIDASAGARGDLTIPEKLEVALVPWDGCPAYRVNARFRYRINQGKLSLAFILDRPEDVLRSAFDEIVAKVEDQTELRVWAGPAPAALR